MGAVEERHIRPRRQETLGLKGHLLAVAAAVAVVAAIGPGGDFPLSDDWSYAHSARTLCESGRLDILPWTGASMVLQAWYGAALCRIFGFSFEVLRASTLVLAVVGGLGFLLLAARAGLGRRASLLACVVFALGPLYLNLSFTFMTDVPFTVLLLWSAYFYATGIEEERPGPLLWAALLCAASVLVRQHGIFLALAASAAIISSRPRSPARAAAALAAPLATLLVFHIWLFFFHGPPAGIENKVSELYAARPTVIANSAFRALEYLGLLLAPVSAALAASLRTKWRHVAALAAALALVAGFLYRREGALMFYLTNLLYDWGLGALTLRDALFLGLGPPLSLGKGAAVALTVSATVSAAALLVAWSQAGARKTPVKRFLLLAAVFLFAGSLLHAGFYFDRYLLPVLPFAAASALAVSPRLRPSAPAWVLAVAVAGYSVAGTHDYMAWNRARHQAVGWLHARGAVPEEIDGGMEYNAWHLAAGSGSWPTKEEARPGQEDSKKSWWWVADDRYVLSFRPLAGYSQINSFAHSRWLAPGGGSVLVLKRVSRDSPEP